MDRSIPRLVLVGLSLLVVGTIAVTGATSTASFAAHNPSWDGTSEFRAMTPDGGDTAILQAAATYDERLANGTLAVVLSPGEAYGEDAAAVRRFVQRGGTLLVAEDYRPHANALLADVGARARVDGRVLRDEQDHERSPQFPRIQVIGEESLTGEASELVFNRGTVVEPNGATDLAESSGVAYLDENGNGELDDAETPTAYPVATVESVGEGRVIVLGDPSVFINAMLDRGDNRAFAQALVAGHDRVLFDVSHAAALPPLVAGLLAIRESPALAFLLGGVLVAAVVGRAHVLAALRRLSPRESGERTDVAVDPDAVATAVSSAHPEWDDERIERIARRVVSHDEGDDVE